MGLASEMKNLSEEIVASYKQRIRENEDSYKQRIRENEELVIEVQKTLDGFRKDHQEMAAALRAGLDKDEKNRLKESVELRKNLSDGEVERRKEFVPFMKNIKNDVKNLKKAVAEDLEGASAAWEKMSEILAQLRKTGVVTPPKEVVRKAEKKEVKIETPAEAVKETTVEAVKEIPVEVQPKVEPKPVVPMTLEEKVLDFINKHPKGARISEMEKPLGETRMKLGFIAKNLLNEGKVLKIENIYYPKPSIEG